MSQIADKALGDKLAWPRTWSVCITWYLYIIVQHQHDLMVNMGQKIISYLYHALVAYAQ